jgi:hypothetical protein
MPMTLRRFAAVRIDIRPRRRDKKRWGMKYHGPRHDLANLHQIKAREFVPLGQSQHGTCPLSCRVGVSAVIEVVSF